MSITVRPELETKLRSRARAAGLTVEAYLGRIVGANEEAEEELERLALEGLNSGEPFAMPPGHWEALHRSLDDRLRSRAE